MPFAHGNGLTWWYDEVLAGLGVRHAVFTRKGGVSPVPWASLNASITTGDDPQRVWENLRRAFAVFGRDPESRFDTWLVHGNRVVQALQPRPLNQDPVQADGIITHLPHITLLMRFADCLPILLYDTRRRVLGLGHAGWRSTAQGIALALVDALVQAYDARPHDMVAVLGPAIGPDHYEVGPEVRRAMESAFGEPARAWFRMSRGDRVYLDLWAANAWQLHQAGVPVVRISGLCTACNTDLWYSHRAEKGRTGRFALLMALDRGT